MCRKRTRYVQRDRLQHLSIFNELSTTYFGLNIDLCAVHTFWLVADKSDLQICHQMSATLQEQPSPWQMAGAFKHVFVLRSVVSSTYTAYSHNDCIVLRWQAWQAQTLIIILCYKIYKKCWYVYCMSRGAAMNTEVVDFISDMCVDHLFSDLTMKILLQSVNMKRQCMQ